MKRRQILKIANLLIAGAGVLSVILMLISSLKPTDALRNSRILTVSLSEIPFNNHKVFIWHNQAISVFRVGEDSAEYFIELNKATNGPTYTTETIPKFFAYELASTYKGCRLSETKENKFLDTDYAGWYDPCHMGVWDYSGRNILGEFTPGNISLPNLKQITNFKWLNETTIEFLP